MVKSMRICSFLPSATEMLFALGAGDDVVAVTFECDYPLEARSKPQVVFSQMPARLTPAEIDAAVRAAGAEARSLYFADMAKLEACAPDLVVVQDLCRVCAIDSPTLVRDLAGLPSLPEVISLCATSLSGVLDDMERLGRAVGRERAALNLTGRLRSRIERIRELANPNSAPRVLCLEWLDPFFQGGHWIPEMVLLAGGHPVLATPGEKSVRVSFDQIWLADPDIIVVMPCGYHLQETVAQYRAVAFPESWGQLRAVREARVYAVDGSAYFSRPGPRLVDGLEILAAILRGEVGPDDRLARLH
jgi:iron complex transport system substrate-binding protein